MTTTTDDRHGGRDGPGDGGVADRYGAIELADGAVVVYDRERQTAWLQSDAAVALEAAT